jgi:hypothetical protein
MTVLFQDPFWIGLFERTDDEGYAVAQQVFGGEPSNPEVYALLLDRFTSLEFTQPIEGAAGELRAVNFKRALRQAKQATAAQGVGTKAQQALALEFERQKQSRQEMTKQEREAEKEHHFILLQQKRKEKHRGH